MSGHTDKRQSHKKKMRDIERNVKVAKVRKRQMDKKIVNERQETLK